MKRVIGVALTTLLLLVNVPTSNANDCDNGCYSYTDPITRKTTDIPYTPEDSQAYANWYQSIVGIPVWTPHYMADGSWAKEPEGYWVYSWQLPSAPIPQASINAWKNKQITSVPVTPITATPVIVNNTIPQLHPSITNSSSPFLIAFNSWYANFNNYITQLLSILRSSR